MIDCNGDGKTDIVHKYRVGDNTRVDVYYSTGTNFTMQRYDTPGEATSRFKTAGDYNGDGKMEIIGAGVVSNPSYILKFNSINDEQLLFRVKDGFNPTYHLIFPLSKIQSYNKGSGAAFP